MKQRGPWLKLVLLLTLLEGSGCAFLLLGAGAAGGYAISKDSVKNVFDLPQDQVYEQSLVTAKEMGLVKFEDRVNGRIKAEIQEADVTITVKPLTRRTVELNVRARDKFVVPKVDIAQEVYTKIIERL